MKKPMDSSFRSCSVVSTDSRPLGQQRMRDLLAGDVARGRLRLPVVFDELHRVRAGKVISCGIETSGDGEHALAGIRARALRYQADDLDVQPTDGWSGLPDAMTGGAGEGDLPCPEGQRLEVALIRFDGAAIGGKRRQGGDRGRTPVRGKAELPRSRQSGRILRQRERCKSQCADGRKQLL